MYIMHDNEKFRFFAFSVNSRESSLKLSALQHSKPMVFFSRKMGHLLITPSRVMQPVVNGGTAAVTNRHI